MTDHNENDSFDFAHYFSDPENRKTFEIERLLLHASESIDQLLESRHLSRAELAKRVGVTPGRISQLLDGTANMTLSTYAELLFALESRAEHICVRSMPGSIFDATYPRTIVARGRQRAVQNWKQVVSPTEVSLDAGVAG